MSNGFLSCSLFSLLLLISAPGVQADILYVDSGASGANDGSTWCDAYVTLQQALASASSSSTVRVAGGTYMPDQGGTTAPGDRNATFLISDGIAVEGGYAGCGQPDPNERDSTVHPTVLSGDLKGDDGPRSENREDNSYRLVTVSTGSGPSTVLDGLVLTAANNGRPEFPLNSGAGLYIEGASPTVRNCSFLRNQAAYGGAVMNYKGSNPWFDKCSFMQNSAYGGSAMFGTRECRVLVSDSEFIANIAEGTCVFHGGSSYLQGPLILSGCRFVGNISFEGITSSVEIECVNGSTCPEQSVISDCEFIDNEGGYALSQVGTVTTVSKSAFIGNVGGGLGLYGPDDTASNSVTNCRFLSNKTYQGGRGEGVNIEGGATIVEKCLFQDNEGGGLHSRIYHCYLAHCDFICNTGKGGFYGSGQAWGCRFIQNASDFGGGGLTFGPCDFYHCMFLSNSAIKGGGLYVAFVDPALVRNCLFAGNHAVQGSGIYVNRSDAVQVQNCTLWMNEAQESGGGLFIDNARPAISNSIIWSNSPDSIGVDSPPAPKLFYNCIAGGWDGPGKQNVDVDPQFIDAYGHDRIAGTSDDDLRVLSDSPVINAGDPDILIPAGYRDLDGVPRILCGRLDMGAYEYGVGDVDCDLDLDLLDFMHWQECVTGPQSSMFVEPCKMLYFDEDVDVDLLDFAKLQLHFSGSQK